MGMADLQRMARAATPTGLRRAHPRLIRIKGSEAMKGMTSTLLLLALCIPFATYATEPEGCRLVLYPTSAASTSHDQCNAPPGARPHHPGQALVEPETCQALSDKPLDVFLRPEHQPPPGGQGVAESPPAGHRSLTGRQRHPGTIARHGRWSRCGLVCLNEKRPGRSSSAPGYRAEGPRITGYDPSHAGYDPGCTGCDAPHRRLFSAVP